MIHRVVRGHDKVWGPLWDGLVKDTAGQYIASELRPGAGKVKDPYGIEKDNDGHIQVSPDKWAKVLTRSYINNIILKGNPKAGEETLVQLISEWLSGPFKTILQSESPAKIVFDELIAETAVFFRLFFKTVNESIDPTVVSYKSNFCVYLWPIGGADYGDAGATLVQIFRAGADLLPEVYIKHSEYCKESEKGSGKGDKWMQDKIKGNNSSRRLEYLFNLKRQQIANHPQAANSGIFPIITTTSQHLDLSKDQDRFPPRIMHNIANIGPTVFNSFHYDNNTARYSFGSYKWTINAMGKVSIDEDSISWDQAIDKHVTNADEDTEIPLSAFQQTENEAKARATEFIEAWRYYSSLSLKQVQTYTEGNKNIPAKTVSAPNCKDNGPNVPINLGGGNVPVKRYRGIPTEQRIKRTPNNSELIQQLPEEGKSRQAFLAKTVVPFNNKDINKEKIINFAAEGYWDKANLNAANNFKIDKEAYKELYVSRFDLWITEAAYGFAVGGPKAVSKYYSRYYTQAFGLTPISVKGVCANENEYDDLADFIREGQVALSQEPKNVFRLYIPAAKIDCLGAIDTFRGGFVTNNTGIPVAPEFEFGFIVFLDLNDNVQDIGSTARTIIYNFNEDPYWVRTFKNYKNDYIVGQLIDEVNTTSGTGDVGDRRGGTTTPRRPPQTTSPGSVGSNILGPNFTIPANPFQ